MFNEWLVYDGRKVGCEKKVKENQKSMITVLRSSWMTNHFPKAEMKMRDRSVPNPVDAGIDLLLRCA